MNTPSATDTCNPRLPISVLILAGGQGSRMGGVDKGLVEFNGIPLVEHALQRVAGSSDDILISCNRNLDRYDDYAERFGAQLVSDSDKDFPGPLAGIQQGLHHALHPALLVIPCDTPALPRDLPARLSAAFNAQPELISLVDDGKRLQPLHAIIPTKLAGSLDAYLVEGKRSVLGWYEQHGINTLDYSGQSGLFSNINHPEELERFSS